jgi:DNA-binding XRE family transcriptional regulator
MTMTGDTPSAETAARPRPSVIPASELRFHFGDRLRKARRAAGLGQKEVAEAIGVSTATVSNWEAGMHLPYRSALADTAQRVSEATGASVLYLLDIDTEAVNALANGGPASRWKCGTCGLVGPDCGCEGGPVVVGGVGPVVGPFAPFKPVVDGLVMAGAGAR